MVKRAQKRLKKLKSFIFSFFCYSSKCLELEMGYCYLRFHTAESRPRGEHLLKISGIFHIVQKLPKNCQLGHFFIFVAGFNG